MEYRYPLEVIGSPFNMVLNPTAGYDHSDVYIYRIFPVPITINIRFEVAGPSYVDVYDGNNNRFLLPEALISASTSYNVSWDGLGTFQPRVGKGGHVTAITMTFQLPIEQVIQGPVFLAGSIHTAKVSILVSPGGMSCAAEVFLSTDGGATKAVTSGPISFVSTGANQNILLPVTMPSAGGNYYTVHAGISIEGSLLAEFQVTEEVIVPLVGPPTIIW
jgi:hypothetical protein